VHVLAGGALLLLALVARATTANRIVRRKLTLTILLALAHVLLHAVLLWPGTTPALRGALAPFVWLPLTLGLVNLVVVLAINPFRSDHAPRHFPEIVQDAIIVAVFAVVALLFFRERVTIVTAAGALVLGFALQETLGNAFAGLALQIDRPFELGHWVKVGDHTGRIVEVTWRATKLRTREGTLVVLPNNLVAREPVTNFSEPQLPTRIEVRVGATYQKRPNEVKQALLEAVRQVPMALTSPSADVVLTAFDDSSVGYAVRFYILDVEREDVAADEMRSAIYYAFSRHGIEIPYPIAVEIGREDRPAAPPEELTRLAETLGAIDVFSSLAAEVCREMAQHARVRTFGAGEVVVRQGEQGTSMFVVGSGRVRVSIDPGNREVARTEAGGYFGEMSMLTGDPRTATVSAIDDTVLLEIDADAMRRLALANPAVVERIGETVARRRAGLERTRADAASELGASENAQSFLNRMRRFLRLPGVSAAARSGTSS
jgi:small-conductance mechanosensitive channel/CRP-like cAMP-binding protein